MDSDNRTVSEAAELYERYKSSFLNYVNKHILATDNLESLIGGMQNLQLMLENHRNHMEFINVVLKTGKREMLLRTLPWVYRSYHSQGFSYDYFLEELNLWQAAVIDQSNKGDFSAAIALYDLMIELHEDNISISENIKPLWDPESMTAEQKEFCRHLIRGNQHEVFSISDSFFERNGALADFYMSLITPAMNSIGHYWERGTITVAEEHLASSIISRVMARSTGTPPASGMTKGKVIVCASNNEYHEIGARMTANIFESEGWDVTYLGANTPIRDLESFMRRIQPDFLGLSVTMAFNLEAVEDLIRKIRSNKELEKTKIIIGGSLFQSYPELKEFTTADYIASGFTDALEYAEKYQDSQS